MEASEITTEKQRLVFLLESERRKTIELLRDLTPYRVIHPESGWRVIDIIGHLATWEREVLAAIQAFHEGDVYTIPNFEPESYNIAQYERRRSLDPAQIRMDWFMARRDLQDVIHDLHDHCFTGEMSYPSGRRGMVIALIEELAEHEAEHRQEIEAVINA